MSFPMSIDLSGWPLFEEDFEFILVFGEFSSGEGVMGKLGIVGRDERRRLIAHKLKLNAEKKIKIKIKL